jgi:hypothetical protein
MNGQSTPRMDYVQSATAAENASSVLYNLSEQCLMAHTLRAVEMYIRNEYKKLIFPIVLQVEKGVRARFRGSKSWTIVTDYNAYISVDEELSHDQKRVCIAHECFHILEFFRPTKSNRERIEEICDIFANKLCEKHHQFYSEPANIEKCKFHGLPINCKRY